MSGQKVLITEVALRDAHQSLLATRMRTEDMLPIAERMDKAGYWSVEMWGGATFDSCIRFLNEDPWERVRQLRQRMPNTRFQMLLRGQNLLGYRHYADDVVYRFVELAASAGIDVFRIFDALNDVRNLETAIKAVKKEGKHVEGTISYTTSPVHNVKMFVDLAVELERMGSDTICIKDMAGLLAPEAAYELISEIKNKVKAPLHLHSHCTSGFGNMTYLRAIQAGVDILDCATSSLSQGTAHPPTETIVAMLKGTERDTGMDLENLIEIGKYFGEVRKKYKKFESSFTGVDVDILKSQIPGGMISNLESQLKQQKAYDKLDEVMHEIPRVREDLGYPPLVTPTSQIVGIQAVLNVVTRERYKVIANETREIIRGRYGKLPGEVNEELKKRVLKGEQPITCRPADVLEPEMDKLKARFPDMSDEDIMVYALFPQVAPKYFENRGKAAPEFADEDAPVQPHQPPPMPATYHISVNGKTYNVVVENGYVKGHPIVKVPAPDSANGGAAVNGYSDC
ncbi:MAG: pyruvate/oxaloacetate carboxyltransferase [Nitrospinae bacterium]|nr:pyruvate/oxaloacetate carboxyltransferase [Nitrospinota bacterium]